jgi:hypothetical protein
VAPLVPVAPGGGALVGRVQAESQPLAGAPDAPVTSKQAQALGRPNAA